MKKNFMFCTLICTLLILTSCSNSYEEINKSLFLDKVNSYDLGEPIDTLDKYDDAKEASLISNNNYYIEYVNYKKVVDTTGAYLDNLSNVLNSNEVSDYKRDYGDNWELTKVWTVNNYYVVLFVDTSYIYIKGDVSKVDTIDKFVNSMLM